MSSTGTMTVTDEEWEMWYRCPVCCADMSLVKRLHGKLYKCDPCLNGWGPSYVSPIPWCELTEIQVYPWV